MTELQWEILDQVYLMNSYQTVLENIATDVNSFDNALVELLRGGLLRQLIYSEKHVDFIDVDPFDAARFARSHFVITKQGLISHTASE